MEQVYLNATFSVEVVLKDKKIECYIVRDRQGAICTIGSMEDVKSFFESVLQKVSSEGSEVKS